MRRRRTSTSHSSSSFTGVGMGAVSVDQIGSQQYHHTIIRRRKPRKKNELLIEMAFCGALTAISGKSVWMRSWNQEGCDCDVMDFQPLFTSGLTTSNYFWWRWMSQADVKIWKNAIWPIRLWTPWKWTTSGNDKQFFLEGWGGIDKLSLSCKCLLQNTKVKIIRSFAGRCRTW